MADNSTYSTTAHRIRPTMFIMVILSALTMSGCDLTGGLGQHIETSVDKAANVIDNGIHDIDLNSATWQSVLQRVADQLPKDISETVRADAQSLATRSIATAGVEFRCDSDFLGNRAKQALQHLKDTLLNLKPSPISPAFCQVDPVSIDLKIPPGKWETVMLYGYDLDHQDQTNALLKVLLLNEQGETMPIPENRIGRTTHYQITLNLSGMAPQLYQQHVGKIIMSWNGTSAGYPEIIIVPWVKHRRVDTLPISSTGSYTPPRVGHGDGDFDPHTDKPTDLTVIGQLQFSDNSVLTRVYMEAREVIPDHTEVQGWSDWGVAYTAPAGWKITEVRPFARSISQAKVTNGQSDEQPLTLTRPAGEVADRFEVWVDRNGDEAGSWSRVIAHWRPLEVTIEEVKPDWLP
jgi:hypothetical protein